MSAVGAVGAVVMAAGAGRRMGYRPKSLLRRDGRPLIERVVRALLDKGVAPVVVVLGHHAAAIEPVLCGIQDSLPDGRALQWVLNPAPDEGQGGSLRTGLAALPPDLDAVLVALADQPLLEPADVAAVLSVWAEHAPGIDLLVPQFDGQPGHPIVFNQAVRAAVMQASGAAGVREWRRAHPDRVQTLPVQHARHVVDVDAPEDLLAVARTHGVRLCWPDSDGRQEVSCPPGRPGS
ncbi:MAG: nucleotidyltransferase family protein [Burkholderiales bacterium]|nr:nucleotidyltransferase family protein [Burkholderiales bacterium]MBS0404548.1 nucleotidyltransferase family protein [Pseudomonadota bacterium]MBS0413248.1 nucleotidyltransferase family protein [Pseudomonadota bacterium]